MAAKNVPNEKTAAYSLFIALIKRDKNTMKILPAIIYWLANRFLVLIKQVKNVFL